MKRINILIPVCLMAITSCGQSAPVLDDSFDVSEMIERMRTSTYRVAFEGKETQTYPEGYEAYNTTTPLSVIRDYGHIDGVKTNLRAARVITDTTMTTYFEAEDGRMYAQVVKEDNTVERSYLSYLGTYYRFGKYYSSPFDFLNAEDFDDLLTLKSNKAFLLFNYYTGLKQPVKKARFKFNDDGLVSSIVFSFDTLPVGIATETSVETVEYDMTGTISFDYDISPIKSMTAYTEKSSKYEDVVSGLGSNYTIVSDSNATSQKLTTYVTEDKIYLHLSGSENTMLSDDVLYIKKGSSYRSYIYTGKEWTRDETVDLSSILPDLSGISPYLMEDKTQNHLSLKKAATAYGADNFLIPYMAMTEGTGLKADMYLKNNKIDYVTTAFAYYSGNIVIKNTYSNYGSTSMPIWFEMPEN